MSVQTLRHARWVVASEPAQYGRGGWGWVDWLDRSSRTVLIPYDPLATSVGNAMQAPGALHWFGTDQLGRDILSRVLAATRIDLAIAVVSVSVSFIFGVIVGGVCGYAGGSLDRWIGRVVDVLMAFPLFVLAMAMVAALGNRVENIVIATAFINLPFYIRFARAEVNARRNAGWVEAARAGGEGHLSVILFFLLPNIFPAFVVQISLNLGWAILNAAGLSFIGLGVQAPSSEWGIMVAEGARFIISGKWWLVLFPGAALMLSVLFFNLLGDALHDISDPRLRT